MTALLGLLAVAGYQNRDKIAEWLGGRGQPEAGQVPDAKQVPVPQQGQAGAAPSGYGGLLGSLGGLLGAGGAGAVLNSGLGELVDRFKQAGQGDKADSWVQPGPNKAVAPGDLEQALGPEALDAIARQTGLSRAELLERLAKVLPEAVDRYTPDGSLSRSPA
ncbi:YidB family protein [Bosea sp. 685]|uniref:YidB family protein n=1 Tax=Bosea sp. 685 TaxID=3080057 RepID=UPI002892B7D7|nr:YidB family protein [Bosea sp. 685]WNJ94130.1 YidB family protein [Bosea sp. 685]